MWPVRQLYRAQVAIVEGDQVESGFGEVAVSNRAARPSLQGRAETKFATVVISGECAALECGREKLVVALFFLCAQEAILEGATVNDQALRGAVDGNPALLEVYFPENGHLTGVTERNGFASDCASENAEWTFAWKWHALAQYTKGSLSRKPNSS